MRIRLCVAVLAAAFCVALASAAPALAVKVGPEPTPAKATGAEARTDELVSPVAKHGTEAGYSEPADILTHSYNYALASAGGESVLYTTGTAAGQTQTADEPLALSTWSPSTQTWSTRSLLPSPLVFSNFVADTPYFIDPSADLSSAVFTAITSYVEGDPPHSPNIYLARSNVGEPEWLGRPMIEDPEPALGQFLEANMRIVGASPDLHTVYFEYVGTLVPGVPEHNAGGETNLYEWHDGVLRDAAVLPNGTDSAQSAEGAAEGQTYVTPQKYDGQVSADGSHLFFQTGGELYVRIDGAPGILVSRDNCIAKEGVCTATAATEGAPAPSYNGGFYASASGEDAFFSSTSRLTPNAPEGAEHKTYEFNVPTQTLAYVKDIPTTPDAAIKVLGISADGSRMLYLDEAVAPRLLEMWERKADGSEANRPIAELTGRPNEDSFLSVRATANGSVFVFTANMPLKAVEPEPVAGAPAGGQFNNDSNADEIYRYAAESNQLTCVSCPGPGVKPSGNAFLGNDDGTVSAADEASLTSGRVADNRGITANGEAVFFETSEALVPQDVNGTIDAYEWKDNHVYLISTGHSSQPSFYLDNGEAGNNVFFATTQQLAPEETEGNYSVYDARIGAPARTVTSGAGCGAHCHEAVSPPRAVSLASGVTGPSGNLAPPPAKSSGPEHKSGKAHHHNHHMRRNHRRHRLRQCRRHARHRRNRRRRRHALARCARRYGHAARRHRHGKGAHHGHGRRDRGRAARVHAARHTAKTRRGR